MHNATVVMKSSLGHAHFGILNYEAKVKYAMATIKSVAHVVECPNRGLIACIEGELPLRGCSSVCFSAKLDRAASFHSIASPECIRIWDLQGDKKSLFHEFGPFSSVTAFEMSKDGDKLAVMEAQDTQDTITIFAVNMKLRLGRIVQTAADVPSLHRRFVYRWRNEMRDWSYSQYLSENMRFRFNIVDAAQILVASSKGVDVFDCETTQKLHTLEMTGNVDGLFLHPSRNIMEDEPINHTVAAVVSNSNVSVWDYRSGSRLSEKGVFCVPETAFPLSAEFIQCADGTGLCTHLLISQCTFVTLWDYATNIRLWTFVPATNLACSALIPFRSNPVIHCAAFNAAHGGRVTVVVGDKTARLPFVNKMWALNTMTGELVSEIVDVSSKLKCLEVSYDDTNVVLL